MSLITSNGFISNVNPIAETIDKLPVIGDITYISGIVAKGFRFIGTLLTNPSSIVGSVTSIAPDLVLIALTVLVILKLLGFKSSDKYIGLVLVVALILVVI